LELGLQRLRYLRFLLFKFFASQREFLQKSTKETKVGIGFATPLRYLRFLLFNLFGRGGSPEPPQRSSPSTANMQASTTTDQTDITDTLPSFVIRHSCFVIPSIRVIRGSSICAEGAQDRSAFFSRHYFCELNCACARRRLSAAPLNSGLRRSAASNSGMLSRVRPDARRAKPRLL
jgi:hypothetical protein